MFDGFSERVIDTGEARISCVIGGSGEPILFLHGFPQTKAMWTRVAARLASRNTVICADLRGYGDSSKLDGSAHKASYAFRSMAGDQVRLLRALGFDRAHVVGHDRGARVAHRLALDHPDTILTLSLLDIVPTHAMFARLDASIAQLYWHWFFLSQAAPFPETMIGANPDYFFEFCLAGWGGMDLDAIDPGVLSEYRRCWRDPSMIAASCHDYRAAAGIDLEHDIVDVGRKLDCPTMILVGSSGYLPKLFDVGAVWQDYVERPRIASIAGGHFFVDTSPEEAASILTEWIDSVKDWRR
jgi:haloacetate dehalogenase